MTNTTPTVLVLGGTGKTGSAVAGQLAQRSDVVVRTAARGGADVPFNWQDPATYKPAVHRAQRVYVVAPVVREPRFIDRVTEFLDVAAAGGVRHVTYLSAYGMDQAPPGIIHKAVEQELTGRGDLSYSLVRPAWFMQNFTDGFLLPVDGFITVPTGEGAEAFVDVAVIAAVAAMTLADPDNHAGAQYALTGPEALTVADAAAIITSIGGEPTKHNDIDREPYIQAGIDAGANADFVTTIRFLTETVAAGRGSRPTHDVERVTGRPPTAFADFIRRSGRWHGRQR
jgi:uncharacterized protein YbjT (DUF2867 family)